MKLINHILLAIFIVFIGCAQQKTPYDVVVQKTGAINGDYVILIYYSPLACLNCNTILVDLLHDKTIKKENTFLLFPSIRAIELKDYENNLHQQGGIEINIINNEKLYYQSLLLAGISAEQHNKPVILLFSPFSKRVYEFELKAPDMASKISAFIKSKQ